MTEIRYDELKIGDIIRFHGANVKITDVRIQPAQDNEFYPEEKIVRFDIEPSDQEAIEVLGNFYSHGTYGGVGCLKAFLV